MNVILAAIRYDRPDLSRGRIERVEGLPRARISLVRTNEMADLCEMLKVNDVH
jgi:hypothetical protein